jgi:hypothetical protein
MPHEKVFILAVTVLPNKGQSNHAADSINETIDLGADF